MPHLSRTVVRRGALVASTGALVGGSERLVLVTITYR